MNDKMTRKMNHTIKTRHLLRALACLAATVGLSLPTPAHPQDTPREDAAIQNTPADGSEPTLDDLLGLDEDESDEADGDAEAGDNDKPDKPDQPADDEAEADAETDPAAPELTRELDKRLSGEEASEQFVQAIQEMEDVAIRLGEGSDPGIDTQRMQDEIILKLEQIISSAEKSPSQQQQSKPGQPGQGKPRQADKGGQQPGQQQGQKPSEQPGQGDQPGQQAQGENGQQPGEQQGEQPGDQQGQKPGGQQAEGNQSGDDARQGDVRNAELSMKDLREGEWGNLPPRLRDELSESLSEEFNPVYRAATEAFYRRIAELSGQQNNEEGNE